ncbi:hypothetical protein ACVIDN_000003 [Rhizobium brockwellii]
MRPAHFESRVKWRSLREGGSERFSFSWKRRTALTFCFYTILGKSAARFAGIALKRVAIFQIRSSRFRSVFAHVVIAKPPHTFADML